MLYHVEVGGRRFEVDLGAEGVRLDGRAVEASLEHGDSTPVSALRVGAETYRLVARRSGRGQWRILLGGRSVAAEVVDERTRAIRAMTGSGAARSGPAPVVAPMPGLVLRVEVAEGDLVQAGQGVAIVEAMKMENELRAAAPGVVRRVHVRQGDRVEKDQVLVELAAPEAAAE